MSTIKKLLLELQSPKNTSLSRRDGRESAKKPLKWVGGYFDCSTCMCLHGSCVVCWRRWGVIRPLSGPLTGSEQLTDSTSEQL